jgi:PAP2 superfamily protein
VALLVFLYVGYAATRAAGRRAGVEFDHAQLLASLETVRGQTVVQAVNGWISGHLVLEVAAAYWYAVAHYLVTPLVLVALWRRDRQAYRAARTVLLVATAAALVCYVSWPVAPPRLVPGYMDTLSVTQGWGWWSQSASAPRGLGGSTNQLAAMPSMHVGWAVWVVVALRRVVARRWALVWCLYPLSTAVVVLVTANHWVADVVAGAAIVLLVDFVSRRFRDHAARSQRRARRRTRARPDSLFGHPGQCACDGSPCALESTPVTTIRGPMGRPGRPNDGTFGTSARHAATKVDRERVRVFECSTRWTRRTTK